MSGSKNKTKKKELLCSKTKYEKMIERHGESNLIVQLPETGEAQILPNGTRIIFPDWKMDEKNPDRGIHNEGVSYMKIYDKCDMEIIDTCSIGEYVFLCKLRRFVSFNENILRLGGIHNGHVLSPKEIASILGMSINSVRDYIKFFKAVEIIGDYQLPCKDNPKITTKCLVINPWVYSKGQYMLVDICDLFANSYWYGLAYARKGEIENKEALNPIIAYKSHSCVD